jgi:uncharacterized membrane protein YqjE
MGCTIVFVILLVIGMGILCFLTGDMTAFIALAATLVIGLGLAGILYRVYRSRQRRKRGNPLSPALDECRRFHPDCSQLAHEFLPDGRFPVQ